MQGHPCLHVRGNNLYVRCKYQRRVVENITHPSRKPLCLYTEWLEEKIGGKEEDVMGKRKASWLGKVLNLYPRNSGYGILQKGSVFSSG